MQELINKVWDWFEEKGLSDPIMQYVKMQEECGELAHELTRGRRNTPEVIDALGDILVTVIGLCHHLNINPDYALSVAYNEISHRKGKVIEGSFVKEEAEKPERELTRNAFYCKKCKMTVESKSVHDYQKCKCGNFTDGGLDYIRRGGNTADMEDRCEWKDKV